MARKGFCRWWRGGGRRPAAGGAQARAGGAAPRRWVRFYYPNDCITSGRAKQAEAKLSKVRVAINEVISTATLRGFTAKLRTWKAVLGGVDTAVRDGTVAAYKIVA